MDLSYIISLCTPNISGLETEYIKILYIMFISGLIGGVIHCSYMCSPFLMMQISASINNDKEKNITELTRLKHSLLIPYHMGRITTYTLLGAITAYFTGFIAGWWEDISAILLFIAGIVMLLSVHKVTIKILPVKIILCVTTFFSNFITPKKPSIFTGYITGVTLGFLPCAMLYSAIFAASSTGNPYTGALSMLLFCLGTIPGLFISAFSGHYIIGKIRDSYSFIPKFIISITAIWLCYLSYILFTN